MDELGKIYVVFQKVNGEGVFFIVIFSNVFKFISKEIDFIISELEEIGYDDEYEVFEFDLLGVDYVVLVFVSNFVYIWEQVGV